LLRQKRGWAETNAKSAKLKDKGNVAFRNGDYKRYAIYTTSIYLSTHEPLYSMYTTAVANATDAMVKGDFKRSKALFRRAQARTFWGDWLEADEDYMKALALQPKKRNIIDGFEELKRLHGLPPDEQVAWIADHK
ncbi:hypothetical protein C8F04DRAFT_892606, partial [Mycena alexandri]